LIATKQLTGPAGLAAATASATAIDPHAEVRVSGTDADWTLEVANFSGGATFEFEPRASLPLIVV
jgi:hypothetical protein